MPCPNSSPCSSNSVCPASSIRSKLATAKPSTGIWPTPIFSACWSTTRWPAASRRSWLSACAAPTSAARKPWSASFDRLPGLNRALVHDLATGRFVEEKVAILIVGPCGTGKSHLAQAIGHLVARQGHDVLFSTQTHLLASLRQAQAVGNYERRFQTLANVPLLIIDDFGLKPLRPPEDEAFHDLVAERYERAATILTSNLDFGEWGDAFPTNKMLGAATLDRLRHGAYRVVLDGDSYRSPKPLPQSVSHPVAKGAKTTHA